MTPGNEDSEYDGDMMRFRRPARPDGLTEFHLADFLDDEEDVIEQLKLADGKREISSIMRAYAQARARWAAAAADQDLTPAQLVAISVAVREGISRAAAPTIDADLDERAERVLRRAGVLPPLT